MTTFPTLQGSMYRQAGYLKDIQRNVDLYTRQLATGKKVSQASDDPSMWLRLQEIENTLHDTENLQSNLSNTTTSMNIAYAAIDGVVPNLYSLQNLLDSIKQQSDPDLRANLVEAYNAQLAQNDDMINTPDSLANKLLSGTDVEVSTTSESEKSVLRSTDIRSATLGLSSLDSDVTDEELDTMKTKLDEAIETVQGGVMSMSTNQYIVESSSTFNDSMVTTYESELIDLNAVDTAEVAISLQMEQIRYQLVIGNIQKMDEMLQYLISTLGK